MEGRAVQTKRKVHSVQRFKACIDIRILIEHVFLSWHDDNRLLGWLLYSPLACSNSGTGCIPTYETMEFLKCVIARKCTRATLDDAMEHMVSYIAPNNPTTVDKDKNVSSVVVHQPGKGIEITDIHVQNDTCSIQRLYSHAIEAGMTMMGEKVELNFCAGTSFQFPRLQ